MNRWRMVARVAVIGLLVAGCAEGVEDPQPAPDTSVQKPPPARTFSDDLTPVDPRLELGGIDIAAPELPNEELPSPGQN